MIPEQMAEAATRLTQLLHQQLLQVDQHIAYLRQIKRCLVEHKIDELNTLLADQGPAAEAMEQAMQAQQRLLQQHGYAPGEQGMQRILKDCQQEDLAELKSTLNERTQQLEKELLINDLLVRKNQQRVHQSIHILSGHGQPDSSKTYSRQGSLDGQPKKTRSLALA